MENKYYTPNIEDIRVGYECEFLKGEGAIGKLYSKVVITQSTIQIALRDIKLMRTPYLTTEQVIAEGWKKHELYNNPNRVPFEKGNYFLILDTRAEMPMLEMIFRDPSKVSDTILNPERFRLLINCPSINEFRMITKLLEV